MRRSAAVLITSLTFVLLPHSGYAQQRPLLTEDPEPIGAGRILFEGGLDLAHGQPYPVSGLEGNLIRLPTIGLSFGLSSIAELQIDGGLYDHLKITARHEAPLSSLVTAKGDSTSDVEDIVVATKIRVLSETANRPAFGVRFATKLPNASNESGLGLDTTDFYMSVLSAKTVQSIRVVGNIGFGILADPTSGNRQNDVLTYGLSFARAITQSAELVGELYGRANTRSGDPIPGTETRSLLRLGGRYTHGMLRLDSGIYVGLTTADPDIGVTVGFTYVINAFTVP
ncbi:MAG TPA: transporter [Vicinamibacterales bacterium]